MDPTKATASEDGKYLVVSTLDPTPTTATADSTTADGTRDEKVEAEAPLSEKEKLESVVVEIYQEAGKIFSGLGDFIEQLRLEPDGNGTIRHGPPAPPPWEDEDIASLRDIFVRFDEEIGQILFKVADERETALMQELVAEIVDFSVEKIPGSLAVSQQQS